VIIDTCLHAIPYIPAAAFAETIKGVQQPKRDEETKRRNTGFLSLSISPDYRQLRLYPTIRIAFSMLKHISIYFSSRDFCI